MGVDRERTMVRGSGWRWGTPRSPVGRVGIACRWRVRFLMAGGGLWLTRSPNLNVFKRCPNSKAFGQQHRVQVEQGGNRTNQSMIMHDQAGKNEAAVRSKVRWEV